MPSTLDITVPLTSALEFRILLFAEGRLREWKYRKVVYKGRDTTLFYYNAQSFYWPALERAQELAIPSES